MSIFERIDEKLLNIKSEMSTLELEVDIDNLKDSVQELENLIDDYDEREEEVIIYCPACLRVSGVANGCIVCNYTGLIYNPKRFDAED